MAKCTIKIDLCDTGFNTCGDIALNINDLLSVDISKIGTLKEFNHIITSELIDAKGWKTESSYPTLKLLYDRYLNSTDYCENDSSKFTYGDMIKFSELIGTYWVDLIEQVVPSTTIWGSSHVYSNTIFDQQKFKYKNYSLFSCKLPNYYENVPSPSISWEDDVHVLLEPLPNDEKYGEATSGGTATTFLEYVANGYINLNEPTFCLGVGIMQTNCGSEFIGTITDYGKTSENGDNTNIKECSISIENIEYIKNENGTYDATVIVGGDVIGPIAYLWEDGQTTQTATGLPAGFTNIRVTDFGASGYFTCYTESKFYGPLVIEDIN